MKGEQQQHGSKEHQTSNASQPRPVRWRLVLGLIALCLIAGILWWLISLPEASGEQQSTTTAPAQIQADQAKTSDGQADFAVNPYLDHMIGVELKSTDHQVTGSATLTGTDFRVSGEIKTNSSDRFVILIYSNKGEDYLDDAPILRRVLDLVPAEPTQETSITGETIRHYTYSFGITMQEIPGLYYYMIAGDRKQQPLLVGKFTID